MVYPPPPGCNPDIICVTNVGGGGSSANTKCCINECPDGVSQRDYPDCSCYCDETLNPCDAPKEYEEPGVDCSCVCKKTDADCPSSEPTLNSTTCICECNVDPSSCSGPLPEFAPSTCSCVCTEVPCNYPDEIWDSEICSCVYNTQGYASFMIP